LPSIPPITFTVPGLLKLLKRLDPTKSSGPDNIGIRELCEVSSVIASPVTVIFQQSLRDGIIPQDNTIDILYADDLILMAESEESLRDKTVKWKSGLEAKGMKMNTGKMKVMFICSIRWKRKVSGPVVYVRKELAIIQFSAMVARN